ncbi:hypothetical protein VNO78_16867 [Psophocarpus tetragonolobus]|uniref:Uncharacterized protein n=1 Tax=Psophocarpus tetragonolobus TaxID=3891 RepID=A0AAN9XKW7_PSOTE
MKTEWVKRIDNDTKQKLETMMAFTVMFHHMSKFVDQPSLHYEDGEVHVGNLGPFETNVDAMELANYAISNKCEVDIFVQHRVSTAEDDRLGENMDDFQARGDADKDRGGSRGLGPGPPLRTLLQTTIRTPEATDSHGGLFPRVALPDLRSRYERLRDVYKMGHGVQNWQMHARNWSRAALIHHIITAHTLPRTQFSTNRDTTITGGQHTPSQHNTAVVLDETFACTRWFTGFCNSHQVSHFATFFIDARAEISVAESHFASCVVTTPAGHRLRVPKNRPLQFQFPWHTKRRGLCFIERERLGCANHDQHPPDRRGARRTCRPFVGRQIRRSN